MLRKLFIIVLGIAASALMQSAASADETQTYPEIIARDGIAFATAEGAAFDVVAAFDNRMVEGNCAQFSTMHSGVRWCFASQTSLDRFTENPDDFLPAFGGRCALGLAHGNLGAKGDPRTAVMIGDRLVLNGSFGARAKFLTDTERYMDLADFNFRFGRSEGRIVPNEEVTAEGEK